MGDKISEEQICFIPATDCVDNLFTLKPLLEKSIATNQADSVAYPLKDIMGGSRGNTFGQTPGGNREGTM